MIKAIATDVDGTLTNCKQIVDIEGILAIRELESRGIRVSLCSGNALCVLKGLGGYIGCTGPYISENGGVVERHGKMWILSQNRIAKDVVAALKEEFGSKVREAWSNRYRFVDAAILRTVDIEDVREVAGRFPGIKVIDSGFAYHIIDKEVDKGKAVIKVAEILGIEPKEIAGVGDSTTDMELLDVCGFKGVVENGDPKLKEKADFVAREPFGRGFAEIAKRILSQEA